MLSKQFISATITTIKTGNAFKLLLIYSYFNLYEYTECFVYPSLQECLHRLILERCNNNIFITDKDGTEIKIDPGD